MSLDEELAQQLGEVEGGKGAHMVCEPRCWVRCHKLLTSVL